MTVFDLMDIYYPDKKRTISRLRNMDKKANQEAENELAYRREHHIYPQNPFDMRDWLSEYAYATNKTYDDIPKAMEYAADGILESKKRVQAKDNETLSDKPHLPKKKGGAR